MKREIKLGQIGGVRFRHADLEIDNTNCAIISAHK
jgi:hypothetical protein